MNSPGKNRKLLALETDLSLTPEDFLAMNPPHLQKDPNLESYLIFLEEIGAFTAKKTEAKIYSEAFELPPITRPWLSMSASSQPAIGRKRQADPS